ECTIYFPRDEQNNQGILTFRGGFQRNSPTRGKIDKQPHLIVKSWEFKTSRDSMRGNWGSWGGGAGWTGQPLIVQWSPEECKSISALYPSFRNRSESLLEIVQVSLCGQVYFIEFESGLPTRDPLIIRNPIKGTPSISPDKNYLLVGQGIPHRGGFAWRCFNLKTNALIHQETLPSSFSIRKWGACDASPLFASNNTFIWPTESGSIYQGIVENNSILNLQQYKYKLSSSSYQGIESSPSALGNLVYFTDNGGNIFCLDTRTRKPRWHFFNTDDSDASPALSIENNKPFIFVGNEVDKQGSVGFGACRKIDGLTGALVWEFKKQCYSLQSATPNNGGMLSTVCIGKNKAEHVLWTIFSRTNEFGGGTFVCLDLQNGKPIYEIELSRYSWVSPIALYDNDGNPYVYFSDVGGNIYLIEGLTGKVIYTESTGVIFESSPVAWNNRIIQPARGNKIFSFTLQ
ncbi:MAG: PQQ-binding-like beta-propeller repeat protein, partial [Bacteroidota bacterium]